MTGTGGEPVIVFPKLSERHTGTRVDSRNSQDNLERDLT